MKFSLGCIYESPFTHGHGSLILGVVVAVFDGSRMNVHIVQFKQGDLSSILQSMKYLVSLINISYALNIIDHQH